ncbi:MAG: sigma-54 dependent transcriptional regulator [Pelobium sp.]
MIKTLIVEDDPTFAEILIGFLSRHHHEVTHVTRVKESYKLLDQQVFELLLVDYRLPDGTGLEILSHLKEKGTAIPVIMMTSFNDVSTAVKSMKLGATDYILKPINPDELLMVINRSINKTTFALKEGVHKTDFIKGSSEVTEKLYQHIDLVAPTDLSVLIQGESGTGKEFAARLLHQKSNRKDYPFIAIDCGALSKDLAISELFGHLKGAFTGALNDKKGQFELAHQGTLFLDEIGNLSYEVQVKLLRALQEKVIQPLGSTKNIKVDVRIIAATNDDLIMSLQSGDFREDLYHRINQFKIQLPPLRERGEDIELFIAHFIKSANQELGRQVKTIAPQAKRMLLSYDWPGNLRELDNVIKRMVLLTPGDESGIEALPEEMLFSLEEPQKTVTQDLKVFKETNEKVMILDALEKVRYNKSKAAKLLNIDRKTLYSKMERYGIN